MGCTSSQSSGYTLSAKYDERPTDDSSKKAAPTLAQRPGGTAPRLRIQNRSQYDGFDETSDTGTPDGSVAPGPGQQGAGSYTIQPLVGFCFQTERTRAHASHASANASPHASRRRMPEKVFVNLFHSKSLSRDQVLCQNKQLINGAFVTYSVCISSTYYQRTQADEKYCTVQMHKVVNHINKTFPDARLDPNILIRRQGFIGESVPYFSLMDVQVIPSSKKAETETVAESVVNDPTYTTLRQLISLIQDLGMQQYQAELTEHFTSPVDPAHSLSHAVSVKAPVAVHLIPPPTMVGYIRKRGHVLPNWSRRYAVLNNGYLTYYKVSSERSPYGEVMRGMVCLAGYREDQSAMQYNMDRINELASREGEVAKDAPRSENSSYFSSDPLYTVHLKLIPHHLEDDAEVHLHELLHKHAGSEARLMSNFYLELPTIAEKYAWSAAIDSHIHFIEAATKQAVYPDPMRFESTVIHCPPQSAVQQVSVSAAPVLVDVPKPPPPARQISLRPSTAIGVLNRIIKDHEEVLFHSHTRKVGLMKVDVEYKLIYLQPRGEDGMELEHVYQDAAITRGRASLMEDDRVHSITASRYPKRLLYVQSSTKEVHGQFIWTAPGHPENPIVLQLNPNSFQVTDLVTRRVFQFQIDENRTLQRWLSLLLHHQRS